MGARAAYVLPPQLAVEPDGGVDVLHDHRGAAGEAAAPLHVGRLVTTLGGAVRRVGHREGSSLMMIHRRALTLLAAAAGTLAASALAAQTARCDLAAAGAGAAIGQPAGRAAGRGVRARGRGVASSVRVQGPRHGGEHVGDLVRALRRRDAVAGGAVEGAGAGRISRCCRCRRIAAGRMRSAPGIRRTGSPRCRCCWIRRARWRGRSRRAASRRR